MVYSRFHPALHTDIGAVKMGDIGNHGCQSFGFKSPDHLTAGEIQCLLPELGNSYYYLIVYADIISPCIEPEE